MTTNLIVSQHSRGTTVEDSFWVRVFQALHPGFCAMSLISGAPVHRSLAALIEARRASKPGTVR